MTARERIREPIRDRILDALQLVYKLVFSPVLHALAIAPAGCRFLPTCSEYAAIAVHEHGFLRGGWMAVRRLLRCRPGFLGGKSGFDPVPLQRRTAAPVNIEEPHSISEPRPQAR